MKNLSKTIFVLFVLFVLHGATSGSEVEKISNLGSNKFINGVNTNVPNPFKMRDPFNKSVKIDQRPTTTEAEKDPLKEEVLQNFRIIGVLLGEERRAVARIVLTSGKLSRDTYMLKEGMKIGATQAELKAILPGGVIFVEKIRNVYDQFEFVETILPLTTD